MGSRKYVTFDWAIKSILRNKANFAVLEGFVSVLLGKEETVKIVSILESETNKNREDEKMSRVDMLAKDENGDLLLFEVQYVRELDYFHRMLYETSRIVTETVRKGGAYSDVKKVYSIHIVYFDLGDGDDCIYKGTTKFVGVRNNKELGLTKSQQNQFRAAAVADIFPTYYIIKLSNYNEDDKSEIGEWMRFLKEGSIDESTKVRGLVEAKKSLDVLTLKDKDRKRYDWYMSNLSYQASVLDTAVTEGYEKGREDGIEEGYEKGQTDGYEKGQTDGMEKGVMKEKKETVLRMKSMGVPLEQIAAISQLTLDELKGFIDE